jgi:adenylylsulfate kinase-like enzyme
VLLITGPVGVGKTAVAFEVSELLEAKGIPHAVVDMDGLTGCFPRPPQDRFHNELGFRNLAAVWANYRAAGASRLVLARVIETRSELDAYRAAVPSAAIVVVRLKAPVSDLAARVRQREVGSGLARHLSRAAELAELMEREQVEDYLVETGGRAVAEIAQEILNRSQWLKQ